MSSINNGNGSDRISDRISILSQINPATHVNTTHSHNNLPCSGTSHAPTVADNTHSNCTNKTNPDKTNLAHFWECTRMVSIFKFLKGNASKLLFASLILIPLLALLLKRDIWNPAPSFQTGKTVYVDSYHGNNSNPGTLVRPFKTLSHALSRTRSGDTVQLFAGQYGTVHGERFPRSIPDGVAIVVEPGLFPTAFKDINNHWAAPFIYNLAAKEIVKGFPDGTFKPDLQLTRAEYAVLLANVFKLPEIQNVKVIQDVGSDFWAYHAIQKTYNHQFLVGFPDGTFHPAEAMQRVQVITSLVSGFNLPSENNFSLLNFYRDQSNIPDWAKASVATATVEQLIVNYPNLQNLNPVAPITRAEASAMLYQALVADQQLPAIPSGHIVANHPQSHPQ